MAERESSAAIEAAAVEWAARVDGGRLTSADQQVLEEWVAGDVRRLGAYARARAMLAHAGRVKALGPAFDPDCYSQDHGDLQPTAQRHAEDPIVRPSRRRFLFGASAAVAAGVTGLVGFSWQAAAATFSTRRGEIRLVPLADGSSMTLNTETTAKVHFSSRERHIELLVGEALFEVVRDAHRPFVVEAGNSRVKAEATSFTVSRLEGEPVAVTVRQGSVELDHPDAAASYARITANTRAVVGADSGAVAMQPVAPAEINRQLAWQQGMLSFEDAPLSQAAAEFARYSDTAIRFDDPSIGNETITGLYAANNPQGFAHSAALSLGLKSIEQPGSVVLSR